MSTLTKSKNNFNAAKLDPANRGYYVGKTIKKITGKTIIYIILIIATILSIFPVFYALMGALQTNQELIANPSRIIPERFLFENFTNAWQMANFSQFAWNSIFMSFFIVLGSIVTCTVAAYVFERGKFKGKEVLFMIFLSSMFVSVGSLTLYPVLVIARALGMNRSLWGIIIIRVLGLNIANLFIARSYISTIPRELDEAAKIDGCSFFKTFTHVIFPILKPLIATIGILEFRFAWNDYLLPLVFTMATPARQPLVVGVMSLRASAEGATNWSLMLAGTSISIIPMILVFIFFNRYFIDGLTAGSVKG